MVKELKKGNNEPYHGYLLNISVYFFVCLVIFFNIISMT